MNEKKMLGDERREWILSQLKESKNPITGATLAKHSKVSRQVIVGDITLLKARNEPIIATSQGYMYMHIPATKKRFEKRSHAFINENKRRKNYILLLIKALLLRM
ncbi:HTH domain-containing protein [Bacillus sp. N9]